MKKLFSTLLALSLILTMFASAQSPLAKDFNGNYTVTTIKALSNSLTDTSATFKMASDMGGFNIISRVDTGATSVIIQASAVYSATQSAMKWIVVDSMVQATAGAIKSFASSYPFIRVIRKRATGGTTIYGLYSAVYLFPYESQK